MTARSDFRRRPVARTLCAQLGSVAACVVLAGGIGGGEDASSRAKNLLLITLDTTRADHIGCYGAGEASTPNLDRLARSGVRFDQVVSPAPLTAPAHATLMTGLVPRRHGVRDNTLYRLAPEIPVLAEILAQRGYRTGAAVSAAVLDRGLGLSRGFAWYDDDVRIGPRSAFNYEERGASQTHEAALAHLARIEPPFFLWIHYFDPHLPYVPPPPFDARFADRPYDGEIAFMDHTVGRLLESLGAHLPRTLIVVAGDHGESLGEHEETTHGVFLYQSTQRVPLIVSGPGLPRGRVVGVRVGLVDVLPTVLELLEMEIPDGLDGRSLRPLIENPSGEGPGDRSYEMESWFPRLAYGWAPLRGLVRGRLVLIHAPRPELYDLSADPRERTNLWSENPLGATMMTELERSIAGDAPGAGVADPATSERLERLRSLGYVGGIQQPQTGDAIDPKDGIRWLAVLDDARRSIQGGSPEKAIGPLAQLLEHNPSNVPGWLTMAAARLATNAPAAAVAAARRAVMLRPADDLARFNLANALSAEAAVRPAAADEAREQYEHTLRINPRRAEAYLNYAALLVRSGEIDETSALLERAERSGIRDPDLSVERAVLELRSGHVDAAVAAFETAVELNPYDVDAVEALARIALRRGRRERARALLVRLLERIVPDDPRRPEIESLLRRIPSSPEP